MAGKGLKTKVSVVGLSDVRKGRELSKMVLKSEVRVIKGNADRSLEEPRVSDGGKW